MITETLSSVLAWIEHWERDRECNLAPTAGSLASAKAEILAALRELKHAHAGPGETCQKCGNNFRNAIHLRMGEMQ